MDISQVKTLCLALGPYRNLTTLTASILFLHPNCQVLNHGSARIFDDPDIDFLKDYSKHRFDNFLRFAIFLSGQGNRGKGGGSITFSHAFDEKHKIGQIFRDRFGDVLVKVRILGLFWKESLRTSQHLRDNNVDLDELFKQNNQLRFLLPIRHPIDCAMSNQRTGHAKQLGLGEGAPVTAILDAVLEEILWVVELKQRYPKRFFYFLENDFQSDTVDQLASFLDLPVDEAWKQAVLEAFDSDRRYQHEQNLVRSYKEMVQNKFAPYPQFSARLLAFVE